MESAEEAPLSVFITGFGKFIGVPYNPTESIVNNLKWFMKVKGMPKGVVIEKCQILVAAGKDALSPLCDFFKSAVEGKEDDPSKLSRTILIHFGVSSAITKFAIESQAINEADFLWKDQLGWVPSNESIIKEDGGIEQIRKTSLPINKIVTELVKMGFPVVVSKDAGRFVCNYVYYNSLRFADGNGIKSLFVHVPLFNQIDEAIQMLFVSSLLEAITISANAWSSAGHAINHIYDILYMMDRDDIAVGVGGEGGISSNGTIQENVGGYLPIIDQGLSTVGDCRYRQSIPLNQNGRLDIDTTLGVSKEFLPQGDRKYSPLKQPTVQQVMKDAISKGPISVFLMGSHTNFALFLMSNPDLKKNIQHIFIMGGGVRSKNSTADIGNLFTTKTTNPYAEFNIFCDPFAAYQVFHSGIPITLVSLDATSDIPLTEEFFHEFEIWQDTYEAKYCFQLLKRTRDTWIGSFYTSFFMWDSFMSGISISIIENGFPTNGENEFAEMENLNLTVVTSNFPYGENDGSNPFFDTPKFNLKKNGVHSGHVQMGIDDSFCIVDNGKKKGICQDGYTKEVNGTKGVQITVAKNAKPNKSSSSLLTKQFYGNFLEALNHPQQSSRFNLTWQFSVDRQIQFKPDFSNSKLGKPVIFDMDMSTGDFLALIYLLKIPVHKLYLKAILISGNGWANAATIDIVYDILHMMGRDDIPVGLGAFSPMGFSSFSCKYIKEIPQGSGGFLDSDTLFGFAHHLPKSPRRYIVDLKLKQPLLATEIWEDILSEVLNGRSRKITILTSGPLTNLAKIVLKNKTSISSIQDVYIVGGHIADKNDSAKGNVFTVPSNQHSEFNFFLDPIAAKMVIESKLNVKLIPLNAQRKIASFSRIIEKLESSSHKNSTPEFILAHNLISQMYSLQKQNSARYQHVNMFLGEILGAVFLTNNIINNIDYLNATTRNMNINVLEGDVSISGQTILGGRNSVDVLLDFDGEAYFNHLVGLLSSANQQSSVIGSFHEQSFGNNGAFFNLYMCPYII